ncbi:MAG TPA: LEA type 2 family protein [Bacteroidia bacterium]|jgi:LEA14-like dessication related protein
MKHYFLLLITVLTLSSCGDFKDVTFKGVEGFKIIQMSQQGIEAEVTARIDNPNKTAFHIYPSDLDATLNGMNAGKAKLINNIRIKPNKEDSYTFKIKSDLSSLNMMDLPRLMSVMTAKNVKVGLKGDLKVGKFLIKKKYPVDMVKNVPMSGTGLN